MTLPGVRIVESIDDRVDALDDFWATWADATKPRSHDAEAWHALGKASGESSFASMQESFVAKLSRDGRALQARRREVLANIDPQLRAIGETHRMIRENPADWVRIARDYNVDFSR